MPKDRDTSLTRSNQGWLSVPEQRVIAWIVPRLPRWMSPDFLTALGFGASLGALAAYALTPSDPAWLWVVNVALIVNWFGDSLDGAVARRRRAERPRYGFFLDQSVDVLSQFLFAIGLGLSGFVSMEVAAIGLATYLMMTAQSLLRAEVSRTFHLASAGFGLTEVRCLLLAMNAAFYLKPPQRFDLAGLNVGYGDILGIVWIMVNLGLYVAGMAGQLTRLAREERPDGEDG
ncbi:CDP-alcohol phosphatidyltransferase family protein [Reyranella sp.]|uniref:CDP-alcohol phosphatidyltransferase family protein n=1 Tax=Reyranella sp. TaxID=1929291 RepID=UPI003BABCAEE